MEILLLVAVLVVAASGVYVAATFDIRITRKVEPLVRKAVQDISRTNREISSTTDAMGTGLGQQLEEVGIDLANRLDNVMNEARAEWSSVEGKLGKLDELKDLVGRIAAAQAKDATDIRASLRKLSEGHTRAHSQLTEISEALARHAETDVRSEHYDRWAAEQMLGTTRHMYALLRGQAEIIGLLRGTLAGEPLSADSDHERSVVSASLPEGGPATT